EQPGLVLVRVLVEVVDPTRRERARAADQAMDLVALGQEQLGEVRPVLACDPGDQRLFRHVRSSIALPKWAPHDGCPRGGRAARGRPFCSGTIAQWALRRIVRGPGPRRGDDVIQEPAG